MIDNRMRLARELQTEHVWDEQFAADGNIDAIERLIDRKISEFGISISFSDILKTSETETAYGTPAPTDPLNIMVSLDFLDEFNEDRAPLFEINLREIVEYDLDLCTDGNGFLDDSRDRFIRFADVLIAYANDLKVEVARRTEGDKPMEVGGA